MKLYKIVKWTGKRFLILAIAKGEEEASEKQKKLAQIYGDDVIAIPASF